jgi:hypothetical protein
MRVVPIRSRLIVCFKLVKEGTVLRYWALCDERCTVGVIGTVLIDSMPMLKEVSVPLKVTLFGTYHAGAQPHLRIRQLVDYIDFETISLS